MWMESASYIYIIFHYFENFIIFSYFYELFQDFSLSHFYLFLSYITHYMNLRLREAILTWKNIGRIAIG